MKNILFWGCLALCLSTILVRAQGPPITADKPILLGSKSTIIKTLTEIRQTNSGTYAKLPIMYHYLPTSNSLVAIHIPMVISSYSFSADESIRTWGLGDISVLAKYQFYVKDGKAKTFRMVIKGLQTFPTGKNIEQRDFGINAYQTHLAWILGYESIKYGISNEVAYHFVSHGYSDELRHKFGVGLPLLKPTYPVKQLNLYFEYNTNYYIQDQQVEVLYAQGIQYAIKQWTFETAIQLPLVQTVLEEEKLKYSLFFGTRYIF